MKKSQNDSELLRFAAEEGIIDLPRVQEIAKMRKREELIKNHPFKIWQGKNGSWYTYLEDSGKPNGRRLVKKSSEKAIKDAIVERATQPTVRDIFDEWLGNKVRREEIELSTRDRYQRQFDKCFSSIAS